MVQAFRGTFAGINIFNKNRSERPAVYEKALERDSDGCTLLHWAASERQEELVHDLLPGIDSSAFLMQDRWGRTPLMAAMKKSRAPGKVKVVKLLWEANGVEGRRLKDMKKGRTALHWMVISMRGLPQGAALCELLSKATVAELMETDNEGNTVLHCAALMSVSDWRGGWPVAKKEDEERHCGELVVETLIKALPREALNTVNNNGFNPLHLAAEERNHVVVNALLKALNQDILLPDSSGRTFLCILQPQNSSQSICGASRDPGPTNLWLIVANIPVGYLEGMPESDVVACWRARNARTCLPGFFGRRIEAFQVLLERTPPMVLQECKWLSDFVRLLIREGFFRAALLVVDRLREATGLETPSISVRLRQVSHCCIDALLNSPLSSSIIHSSYVPQGTQ